MGEDCSVEPRDARRWPRLLRAITQRGGSREEVSLTYL